MRNGMIVILIFVLSLSFFLVFNSQIPVTDPVECNYALTAKEMMESGDWLSPRIYGQYWFDKPVMIYWLIGVSYLLFGINEFAARFPSAFFSAASVAFLYWFTYRLYGVRQIAFFGAIVLGTSLEYWILARMIITDAVLFLFTSVALATLYLGFRNHGHKWFILAYASTGLAVLTKGPVGLVLPGIIITTYILVSRQWGLLKKLYLIPGMAVFLLVAAPWYWGMYSIHGKDFIDTFLGLHNYLRATVSEHPKDNVFYYYLVLFPISMLPWSGVLVGGLLASRLPRPVHAVYLWIWMIVILVFYTAMATKYLTYVFPASFPAAILIGYYLQQFRMLSGRKRWLWLSGPTILLYLLLGAGTKWIPGTSWSFLYFTIAVTIAGILWLQVKGKVRKLPEAVALSTVLISLIILAYGLAPLAQVRSAKEAVHLIPVGSNLGFYGKFSASAVFYSSSMPRQLISQYSTVDDSDVWSKKYNQPQELVQNFNARTYSQSNTYILVSQGWQQDFSQTVLASQFHKIADYSQFSLYQRTLD